MLRARRMLIQLFVSTPDAALREALESELDANVRVETVGDRPDWSLHEPDLVLLDASGAPPLDEAVSEQLDTLLDRGGVGVLVVVRGAPPDARTELLARGCLAVIDGEAPRASVVEAVAGACARWRQQQLGGPVRRDVDPHGASAVREAEVLIAAGGGAASEALDGLHSSSPAMLGLLATASRVAQSESSLLILGETGVGKERLAEAIHRAGPRADQPMVVVNCGAIPETLLESELFGHERGAFTGAMRAHRGYFEMAHRGTLLLDEIGEMPLHLQVKLLRVLQERTVRRVGGESAIPVDVRVLAATNRDLRAEMDAGRFRSDLYFRLSVVTLTIPPLRARREDVRGLVDEVFARFRGEMNTPATRLGADAYRALEAYDWPGNVRELINVVERAVLLAEGETVGLRDLPPEIAAAAAPSSGTARAAVGDGAPVPGLEPDTWRGVTLREARRQWNHALERAFLERALAEHGGRVGRVAAAVGLDPRSLYEKMRVHGLRKEDFRRPGGDPASSGRT